MKTEEEYTLAALEMLRDLFIDNDWLRTGFCQNKDGKLVEPAHRSARKFSILAGIKKVTEDFAYMEYADDDFFEYNKTLFRGFDDLEEYYGHQLNELGNEGVYDHIDGMKRADVYSWILSNLWKANHVAFTASPCGGIKVTESVITCWGFREWRIKDDVIAMINKTIDMVKSGNAHEPGE